MLALLTTGGTMLLKNALPAIIRRHTGSGSIQNLLGKPSLTRIPSNNKKSRLVAGFPLAVLAYFW